MCGFSLVFELKGRCWNLVRIRHEARECSSHITSIAISENSGVMYHEDKIRVCGLANIEIFYKDGGYLLLKPNQEILI